MAGAGRLIRGSAGDFLFFLLAEMTQARQRLLWRRDPMWLSSTSEFLCWSSWCKWCERCKHAGSKNIL